MEQTLKIYRALKTNYTTQDFGENKACALVDFNGQVVRDQWGRLKIAGVNNLGLCPTGYKKFYPLIGMKGHNGLDQKSWSGEPLYFNVEVKTKDGNDVRWYGRSEVDNAGGIGVDVISLDPIYFPELPKESGKLIEREWAKNEGWLYVKFRFWHLKETWIESTFKPKGEYQWVKTGQFIGRADNTGASSGDHLHFGMKIVSTPPSVFTLDSDNQYYGAIKLPTYTNRFILDVLKERKVEEVKELQLTLIELLTQYITYLQIQVRKAGKAVGGFLD